MNKQIKKINGLAKFNGSQILILTEKVDEIISQVNWLTATIRKRLDELNPYDSLPVRKAMEKRRDGQSCDKRRNGGTGERHDTRTAQSLSAVSVTSADIPHYSESGTIGKEVKPK